MVERFSDDGRHFPCTFSSLILLPTRGNILPLNMSGFVTGEKKKGVQLLDKDINGNASTWFTFRIQIFLVFVLYSIVLGGPSSLMKRRLAVLLSLELS